MFNFVHRSVLFIESLDSTAQSDTLLVVVATAKLKNAHQNNAAGDHDGTVKKHNRVSHTEKLKVWRISIAA